MNRRTVDAPEDFWIFNVSHIMHMRYKEIMNLRSGSERVNAVNDSYKLEGVSRNADLSHASINALP